jgi:hypothetical protein
MAEIGESRYCPACHGSYPDWTALKTHLQKAQTEGDLNHIEIIELEGWEEFLLLGEVAKNNPDEQT